MIRTLCFLLLLCSSSLSAQRGRTAPEECRYCEGDPSRMEAAGIVSHGPFPFGASDTMTATKLVPSAEIYWIESAHFRLGFGAGAIKLMSSQTRSVRAELERLQLVLPAVKPKVKLLDPWLRTHLYAQRFEDAYATFMELMQVVPSDFPNGTSKWLIGSPYWGEGPYLGQNDKYEVLLLVNAEQQLDYLSSQFGLQIRHSQKWNIHQRGSLILVSNIQEDELQNDTKLHGHLVFNLVHNFVDGFKFYAYDTPFWLQEGLAHYFERRISKKFNSYSRSEGGVQLSKGSSKWIPKVKGLISADKAPRLAELMSLKAYADFELNHHYTCWSMVSFMIETKPEAFAELNKMIHGRKDAAGYPDGNGISDAFRQAFKQTMGISYAAFDREWAAWALLQKP